MSLEDIQLFYLFQITFKRVRWQPTLKFIRRLENNVLDLTHTYITHNYPLYQWCHWVKPGLVVWPWSFYLAILNLGFFPPTSEMAWGPVRDARRWPKRRGPTPRPLLQPENFKPKLLLFYILDDFVWRKALKNIAKRHSTL